MPARQGESDKRRRLRPLKQRADQAERAVTALGARIREIDAPLAAPDLFARDPTAAGNLAKERAETERALAAAEARWLEAQDDYESAAAVG
jgi:ATP-binding cassette subfamily F protein 3